MSRYITLMLCAPAVMLMACSLESKPDDAFLDSVMILRPGVDDAHTTVREYVDMLASRTQTDGTPVNDIAPNTAWAVGWGGQRIGWNKSNDRMLLVFSNEESWLGDAYGVAKNWGHLQ